MMRQFLRRELYDLVWAEPTKTVAKSLEISDVGLAKICRKANIPLPPRGYWARKEAGQSPPRTPLPPRLPGESEFVGGERYQSYSGPDWKAKWLEKEEPAALVFEESMEDVERRVRKSVGTVKLIRRFTPSHPLVDRLLKQDEERRIQSAKSSWDDYKPKFANGEGARWLQIVNSLSLGLQPAGCSVSTSISRYGPDLPEHRKISVTVGTQHFEVTVGPFARDSEKGASSGGIFALKVSRGETLLKCWTDAEGRTETQLTEIVVYLLVTAEQNYREQAVAHREWIIKRRAEIRNELAQAAAERERLQLEDANRRYKLELNALTDQAEQYFQAARLREYVAVVVRRFADDLDLASAVKYFAEQTLARADEIDPVANGAALKKVREYGRDKRNPDTSQQSGCGEAN